MADIFTIRQETPQDYDEVYNLVKQAFDTASYSDGTEADYLNSVRQKDTFIPELSLVATDDLGKIVGQIVLYRTSIVAKNGIVVPALVLSPISVHPLYFRKGIAKALVEQALSRAADMGFVAVFLCGEPDIYKSLGFVASYEFDIYHKDDPKAEWCMGRELSQGVLEKISGVIDIV